MRTLLDKLIPQLEILDTRLAKKKAEQIKVMLSVVSKGHSADAVALAISNNLSELRERIEQELEDRVLYYVPTERASLLKDGIGQFGTDTIDRFSDASTDLGESASCLGLARNTACVFHLMRAMERAVATIGAKLNVTVITKDNVALEWGKIIANMRVPIEKMPKGEERNRWSEVLSRLYHAKQCWRNPTMHPKQTYTEEEAAEVFQAVKGFLRHAARLL